MSKGYRELVGLQATFSEVAAIYNIEHFYRWKENGKQTPTLTMRSYDMVLTLPASDIIDGLTKAFAPAILSVWKQVKLGSYSEYLQFQVGARPDEVGLGEDWTIWAEW